MPSFFWRSRRHRPYLYWNIARSAARAWQVSRRLPPGGFHRLDELERTDRFIFQKLAQEFGPIFRGVIDDRPAICVVGSAVARRLLRANTHSLRPVTIDVSSAFPGEFMRGMAGEAHKYYRSTLVRNLRSLDLGAFEHTLRAIIGANLRDYISEPGTSARPYDDFRRWSSVLSAITSSMLIRLVFGAERGTPVFECLLQNYRDLGPHGVVWNIGENQVAAFVRIKKVLSEDPPDSNPPGLMALISADTAIDATLMGNLVYMVETGRYDMAGLFRWITKYAAEQPEWLEKIEKASENQRFLFAEAFVLEVLRLQQSERLMRDVLEDFSFEGLFFPKGALLRICMWESHKDADVFEDPFKFDPQRFLAGRTYGDRFSPFGLDQHHCPFSGVSLRLASLLLLELACNFRIEAKGGDPSVRGVYHWEPAPDMSVRLLARSM